MASRRLGSCARSWRMRAFQLAGERFGRLVATTLAGKDRFGLLLWKCQCDCGATTIVPGRDLVRGRTKSCGCLSADVTRARNRRHGLRRLPEYEIWKAMKQRCGNPRSKDFPDYGGRGISVSEPWRRSFAVFYADMGPRPPGALLDRRDNEAGYSKENCRWATATQSVANRRPKTHCKNGHAFTPENTKTYADGRRSCWTCLLAYHRRWQRQRKERS
jgi:hypothetical protein